MMEPTFSSLDARLRAAGRRLVSRHPRWEWALLRARDGYARATVRLRWVANRIRYAAPPDPYRLLEVDPAEIEWTAEFPDPKFKDAGVVAGGEWDRPDERFEEMDVYQAYERHFVDRIPWEETAFYDRIVADIEGGQQRWGCRTRREFDQRCERLDALYETIRTDGYRTQAELRDADGDDPVSANENGTRRDLKTERFKNEIAVSVGRDGEVLFADGRNRLSIVKLLDLDTVPVRVLRRHRCWQEVRDAYVQGNSIPADYRDHPDLVGLGND